MFPILLCLVIGVGGMAASVAAGQVDDVDGSIAAVFPPWWSASRVFAAASDVGNVVDSGTLPFVLIVQSQRPGLADRLRAAGALLILNPLGLGGCGGSPSRDHNV